MPGVVATVDSVHAEQAIRTARIRELNRTLPRRFLAIGDGEQVLVLEVPDHNQEAS